MARSKSKPRKSVQKSSKAIRIFIVFLCLMFVAALLLLFYPPVNRRVKKSSFYKYFKTTENSLIEDDAQQYKNSKSNNWLRNFDIKKEEKNKSDKESENSPRKEGTEYGKKDRDYLDNLIKKSN